MTRIEPTQYKGFVLYKKNAEIEITKNPSTGEPTGIIVKLGNKTYSANWTHKVLSTGVVDSLNYRPVTNKEHFKLYGAVLNSNLPEEIKLKFSFEFPYGKPIVQLQTVGDDKPPYAVKVFNDGNIYYASLGSSTELYIQRKDKDVVEDPTPEEHRNFLIIISESNIPQEIKKVIFEKFPITIRK